MLFLRVVLIGLITGLAAVASVGQGIPEPTPYSGRQETSVERIRRQDRQHDQIAQQTFNNLYGQGSYANSSRFNGKWRERMVTLYREPDDSELAKLRPDEKYTKQYAGLLKEKDTGIFVLLPDQGCSPNGETVNVSEECASLGFPGSGSSFSFRFGNYRIRRLSDISFVGNSMTSSGFFASSVYLVLGDTPLESVALETKGIPFLAQFKAPKTPDEAIEAAKQFAKGVKKDGFLYGRGVFATANTTFAMRSIAYRGKFMRAEEGVAYNELDFDKRRDVIVAFRIVEVAENGAATIVWKILRSEKSPKMKAPKDES